MGLLGSDIGVKLPDRSREELLAQPGAGPFGPADRPMGGYVTLPATRTVHQAAPWIDQALAAAAALPPKATKRTRVRKAAT